MCQIAPMLPDVFSGEMAQRCRATRGGRRLLVWQRFSRPTYF
jgi:hypothetical protein